MSDRQVIEHSLAQHGFQLNEHQQAILDAYYAAPVASGKSTLLALLYMQDRAAPHYVETFRKRGFPLRHTG